MRQRRVRACSLALGLALSASSCVEPGPNDSAFVGKLLVDWAESVLMPQHDALAERADALAVAADAACTNTDAANTASARDTWAATHAAMKQVEVSRFGPYVAFPERWGPTLDFWPVRPDQVDDVLFGAEPITVDLLAASGATVRGLPVIELLLWPAGPDGSAEDAALALSNDGARRCEFLQAAAADAATLARGLRDAWAVDRGGFANEVAHPEESEYFADNAELAFAEIVNRMGFSVDNIRSDKLGATSANAVECAPSDRSVAAMLDVLVGVRRLFYGGAALDPTTAGADDVVGLIDHPRMAQRAELTDDFDAAAAAAEAALLALPRPFSSIASSDGAAVAEADDQLATLQRLIQADLTNVLGTIISFNDADGD